MYVYTHTHTHTHIINIYAYICITYTYIPRNVPGSERVGSVGRFQPHQLSLRGLKGAQWLKSAGSQHALVTLYIKNS
jgi:hypothetical protein